MAKLCIFFFVWMALVSGCKTIVSSGSDVESSDQVSKIPAEDQPQVSEESTRDDIWKEIGRIARPAAQKFGLFCSDLRKPGYGMPDQCRDYCDTFLPDETIDKSLYSVYLASWLTVVPESIRSKIVSWTDWIISGAGNKPVYADRIKGLSCAVVMMSYISKEIFDYNRCHAGSGCLNCGDGKLAMFAKGVSMACRQGAALGYCAATLGITAEAIAGAAGAAGAGGTVAAVGTVGLGTCMAQGTGNYLLYRDQCQKSCEQSLHAARPVAQSTVYTQPSTGKTFSNAVQCCRCEVDKFEDHSAGDAFDLMFASDYVYSMTSQVSATDAFVKDAQCEGRNGMKRDISAVETHNGYGVYLKYKNCSKHWYEGKCPLNAKGSERGLILGLDER